jgi:hypothetical protein
LIRADTGLPRSSGSTAPVRGEAFRHLATLGLDDPALKWAWAFLEREKLWLAHDAWWIEKARAGWPHDSIKTMLQSYGLLRGTRGSLLAGDDPAERDRFALMSADYATRLKPFDATANTAEWQQFGRDFAKACGVSPDPGWFMPSATLKALWFHRPGIVPMYDQWAVRGLNHWIAPESRSSPRSDFLARAYALLEEKSAQIDEARALVGSDYPYRVRVLDGFLWLEGNPASKTILERFRSGCNGLAKEGREIADA